MLPVAAIPWQEPKPDRPIAPAPPAPPSPASMPLTADLAAAPGQPPAVPLRAVLRVTLASQAAADRADWPTWIPGSMTHQLERGREIRSRDGVMRAVVNARV
jgi:hypothetical protein